MVIEINVQKQKLTDFCQYKILAYDIKSQSNDFTINDYK